MVNHVARTPATFDRGSASTNHSPGVLGAVERVKSVLGASTLSTRLRRPRFLRGPYLDRPVDAAPITTQRLTLRPHRVADSDEWYALQSNPDVVKYMYWGIRTRAESREHLMARARHTRLWQTDDFLAFAVELNGVLIGDVSLQLRSVDRDVRSVEMGWLLDPEHQGNGYAIEAAQAALDVAFSHVGAICHGSHRSSKRAQRRSRRTFRFPHAVERCILTPHDGCRGRLRRLAQQQLDN